jgi:hypothetical protein
VTGVELVERLEQVATDARRGDLVDGELVRELEAIADRAERAYHGLITGQVPKGTGALWEIRNMARDAARWARARQEVTS